MVGPLLLTKMVGDSPEYNNLDTMLFADLVFAVQRHCAATRKWPVTEIRKFSMATPKTIQLVVSRLWTSDFISSARIIEDSDKIYDSSMQLVLKNLGKVVEHCGDRRKGKRAANQGRSANWGGKRTKSMHKGRPKVIKFHPDRLRPLCMSAAVSQLTVCKLGTA